MNNKAELGDMIELQKQDVEVVECEECNALMVNIDADEVQAGDLVTLKRKGVRLSNPETEEHVCLKCEISKKKTLRESLSNWFDSDDDDDDTPFFTPIPSSRPSSTPIFGGSKIGGGFGGFGGGMFSGGGASRSF